MTDLAESLLIGLCIFAIGLSLLLWGIGIDRAARRKPLIHRSPRRTVPWTIIDLIAILFIGMCLLQVATLIVAGLLGISSRELLDPDRVEYQLPQLVGFSCASMVTWLISLLWLRFRSGASAHDLGFEPFKLSDDLPLSLAAFIMLVVPTLLIQFLAVKLFPTDQQHPFIEMIKEDPDPRALIAVAVAAVIVAPVVEEFLFRVLLQSWLERIFKNLSRQIALDRVQDTAAEPTTPFGEGPSTETEAANSDLPPQTTVSAADTVELPADGDLEPEKTQWTPIFISGVIFGLVHFGQGPAPIALTFLGFGLGYLFQRTHRVWPCMMVHALVNLLAVVQLGIYISNPAAP